MTDKLADALKDTKEFIERMPKGIGRGAASPLYIKIVSALEEHEATKAATPDDVREVILLAMEQCDLNEGEGGGSHSDYATAIYADLEVRGLLRNTQGVPREVVDALVCARQSLKNPFFSPSGRIKNGIPKIDEALAILDQHARGG